MNYFICLLFSLYNSGFKYRHLVTHEVLEKRGCDCTHLSAHVHMWCDASQISIHISASYWSSMSAGYVQARNCVYFLCLLWQVLATIFSLYLYASCPSWQILQQLLPREMKKNLNYLLYRSESFFFSGMLLIINMKGYIILLTRHIAKCFMQDVGAVLF